MNRFNLALLQIARLIAGRDRAEWSDAMAAETASIGGSSSSWALGCVWASFKDRFAREARFLSVIALLVFGPYLIEIVLFFPTSWLWLHHLLPGWVLIGQALLNPLPFTYFLGRTRQGLAAYLTLLVCFPVSVMIGPTVFWLKFGRPSPLSWFGDHSTWFMMTPAAGLSCYFLIWLAGTWLGSRKPMKGS